MRISTRAFTVGALLAALVIACVLSLWASQLPDGLTYVADVSGFAGEAHPSVTAVSPLAEYGASFVENPWLSLAVAGAAGCTVTFAFAFVIGRLANRRKVPSSHDRD
ncbi:hypothetical protein ASF62_08680 [Leifsonia sp. Leaf325]|nr:hypothetical protein ASF62_08680 [Leifsonia sp. Leaf325]